MSFPKIPLKTTNKTIVLTLELIEAIGIQLAIDYPKVSFSGYVENALRHYLYFEKQVTSIKLDQFKNSGKRRIMYDYKNFDTNSGPLKAKIDKIRDRYFKLISFILSVGTICGHLDKAALPKIRDVILNAGVYDITKLQEGISLDWFVLDELNLGQDKNFTYTQPGMLDRTKDFEPACEELLVKAWAKASLTQGDRIIIK
jgi:hypothetical protein